MVNDTVVWFKDLTIQDVGRVGGKNASLGEMMRHLTVVGVQVPEGFATTVSAYRNFLSQNNLDNQIKTLLDNLDVEDIQQLSETGSTIREWILGSSLPPDLISSIQSAYSELKNRGGSQLSVAVRSSATAEDLPDASFAGQQETFLNVNDMDNLILAVKRVFASLFTDRAIAYRFHQGYSYHQVALSVGIQQMVRSDSAASGVMFTLDTESGFDKTVLITSSYGLGELLVQGAIDPDEFYVYKPALLANKSAIIRRQLGTKLQKMIYAENVMDVIDVKNVSGKQMVKSVPVPIEDQKRFSLTDEEVEALARQALIIEQHYGCPMDIEWAKDGQTNQIYILQARPETVITSKREKQGERSLQRMERYTLKNRGSILATGRSIGQKIGQGTAKVITDVTEMHEINPGEVLVTDMTDPDWEPIMKRASAIITNRGGRTCHAAIVARELGIPAVVGCGDATQVITTGTEVTVSCAEGDIGYVYQGLLDFDLDRIHIGSMPELELKIMMNIGNPERAFDFQKLPSSGVGLARIEFIINQTIGIHPKACLEYRTLPESLQKVILERTAGYRSPRSFYVDKLTEGIAMLAAAFSPKPVIVRLSDFKSNEYANLLGGSEFEPHEENPMLGFRGASRYISSSFKDCFALECEALGRVREAYGLTNVEIMVPFVRTVKEAKTVIELLADFGLKRGENGLKVIMMCEIPANAIMAEAFLEYFDGFSIGSNDLTQLTLGLDRDSGLMAHQFDEREESVKILMQRAIRACKAAGKYIGICGQGPSDHPDFAQWLLEQEIDSISLNPDSVLSTWIYLAKLKGDRKEK